MTYTNLNQRFFTRRRFCKGALAGIQFSGGLMMLTAARSLPGAALDSYSQHSEPIPSIQDSRIKELSQRCLDAAMQSGAEYADVRLTHTKQRDFHNASVAHKEVEELHTGVRALVNGLWGFAASWLWDPEEMIRLGKEAAFQAKINVSEELAHINEVILAPLSPNTEPNGHWETPVIIDAFTVHPQEIRDHILGLNGQLSNEVAKFESFGIKTFTTVVNTACTIWTQNKAFGATDGRYYTQRLHRTGGGASVTNLKDKRLAGDDDSALTFAGTGWEGILNAPVVESVRRTLIERVEMSKLPVKPLDVGRYTTVLDSSSMARLLSITIGQATEIDRVLGYEANAGGTSYINAPEEMLDTYSVGSSLVSINVNRSDIKGLATTQWDDEGVMPRETSLIQNGILKGFQTSREGAEWIGSTYKRRSHSVESGGYLFSNTGADLPLIHTGNISLMPGESDLSHKNLEEEIDHGMSVVRLNPKIDFQLSSGTDQQIQCYEVKNGKRVARIANAGVLFKTPELWNGIVALGGVGSARSFGLGAAKGEPEQQGFHTAKAVPALIKDLSFIDPKRR